MLLAVTTWPDVVDDLVIYLPFAIMMIAIWLPDIIRAWRGKSED
jgi:branched-subunit amino acid transport protein